MGKNSTEGFLFDEPHSPGIFAGISLMLAKSATVEL